MTAESLQSQELLAAIDEKATSEQKLLNEIRLLREENRRLRSYEYDSDMAAQFIASKDLKYEYMNFVMKQQAARRPKLKLVGDE